MPRFPSPLRVLFIRLHRMLVSDGEDEGMETRHGTEPRVVTRGGLPNIVRVGENHSHFDDFYHLLLTLHWEGFLAFTFLLFVGANAIFAILYLLGGNQIAEAQPGSFWVAALDRNGKRTDNHQAMMFNPNQGVKTMAINNSVTLIGNLGQDPKILTKDGKERVILSLCTHDTYKDRESGEWKKKAPIWHSVIIFGLTAQEKAKALEKGNLVKIIGSLSYRTVKNQKGYDIKEATIIGRQIKLVPLTKRS